MFSVCTDTGSVFSVSPCTAWDEFWGTCAMLTLHLYHIDSTKLSIGLLTCTLFLLIHANPPFIHLPLICGIFGIYVL